MADKKSLRTRLIPRDISENLGKLPAQALDMEQAVLGALLLDKKVMNTAMTVSLKAEHFYAEVHQIIFSACYELFQAASPIDLRTVVNQLRKTGKIELVGGPVVIAELTSGLQSAANVEYHMRVVQEKYMKREMTRLGSMMHEASYSDEGDVFEEIEKFQRLLFAIDVGRASQRKIIDMRDLYSQTVHDLQAKTAMNGVTGIPSGFQALDRITNGWQNSDFIVVAARPGAGKTAYMLSIARTASRVTPVAIFSLEMSALQLGQRLISADLEIENDKIRSGLLTDADWARLGADPTRLSSAKLYIDDTAAISIYELRSKCMQLKAEKNIGLIVIDYLQLMKGDKDGNREQEIASISRGLKNLAKELNVPVIALSQLSRAVEARSDKRPMLSDLRESGSLEMDTDVVQFLYRAEYYKIFTDDQGNSTAGVCEVDTAKHRNGSTGVVKIKFQKYFTKFVDWDESPTVVNTQLQVLPRTYTPQYDPSEARNKKDDSVPF